VRSNGLLAAVAGALVLASACSDDGGTPPVENTAPVASFAVPACTINVACDFASTSTDDAAVTAWSWDFDGDGTADATTSAAPFTYTAPGTFNVSLTVRDAEGLSGTKTSSITIDPEGSPPPDNTPPTASFDFTCTDLDCSFTSTSQDAAPGTIVKFAWTFGDDGTADVANPSHSYTATASMDFPVTLTVTDNEGATGTETHTVTVAPAPVPNTPPTAGFTHTCDAEDCSFISTSTDVAPGTIVSFAWTFGDNGTAAVANPSHTYGVVNTTDFTVTLTVTDDQGATDVETQTISVSPPPPGAEGCTTVGTRIECLFDITSESTIKLKLLGVSCSLDRQRITIPAPIGDQVFLVVCSRVAGDSTKIFGGPADTAIVFEPGSQVHIKFNQGIPDAGEPTPAPPSAHFLGSFPNWTVEFEDGQNPGGPGEPDFADVVLGVQAVPHP
jgi:PKD repeat protein